MLGIDNLKAIVNFGIKAEQIGVDLFSGGSFHADKLSELLPLYTAALPAFAGVNQVVPELKDLDATEAADLVSMVVTLGVLSEHAADTIQKAITTAFNAYQLFQAIKA